MILGIEVFTAHIASGSIYLSLWPAGRPPPPAIGCGLGRWLPVWCFPTRWPQLWWSLSQPGPERAGSGWSSARNGRPPVQLSASSAPLERGETWNEWWEERGKMHNVTLVYFRLFSLFSTVYYRKKIKEHFKRRTSFSVAPQHARVQFKQTV